MHNKSFTVDGRATIVGGRNVGDEYFGTGLTPLFVDFDVMAVGDIVLQIAADFDRYWAALSVYPADLIVGKPKVDDPIGTRLAELNNDPQMSEYKAILESSDIVASLAAGKLELEWTTAVLVSDDPIKGQGAVPREDLLASRLKDAVGDIKTRLDGVSAYFVPGAGGVEAFATLEARGVDVRMLTNSMQATDVLPVHAGYAKRRKAMLESGVELFELRSKVAPNTRSNHLGPFGSKGASLHSKTFAIDGERIFVGSFNFDPRSTRLNTEMGLLINSEQMAQKVHKAFDEQIHGLAWRVEQRDGKLVWIDSNTGSVSTSEPGSNLLNSIILTVVGWLPVEWLL